MLTYRVLVNYDQVGWNWTLVSSITAEFRSEAERRAHEDYGDNPIVLVLADEWRPAA